MREAAVPRSLQNQKSFNNHMVKINKKIYIYSFEAFLVLLHLSDPKLTSIVSTVSL